MHPLNDRSHSVERGVCAIRIEILITRGVRGTDKNWLCKSIPILERRALERPTRCCKSVLHAKRWSKRIHAEKYCDARTVKPVDLDSSSSALNQVAIKVVPAWVCHSSWILPLRGNRARKAAFAKHSDGIRLCY